MSQLVQTDMFAEGFSVEESKKIEEMNKKGTEDKRIRLIHHLLRELEGKMKKPPKTDS